MERISHITVALSADLKRKFKLFAVRSGKTMQELIIELITLKVR